MTSTKKIVVETSVDLEKTKNCLDLGLSLGQLVVERLEEVGKDARLADKIQQYFKNTVLLNPKTVKVVLELPPHIVGLVERLKSEHGITLSQLVRYLIETYCWKAGGAGVSENNKPTPNKTVKVVINALMPLLVNSKFLFGVNVEVDFDQPPPSVLEVFQKFADVLEQHLDTDQLKQFCRVNYNQFVVGRIGEKETKEDKIRERFLVWMLFKLM